MTVDDSYTKSLLHFGGVKSGTTFTDESGKTWMASNATTDTLTYKFGGSSGFFNNSGEIYTVDHSDFTVSNDDWTIDLWVCTDSVSSGNHIIFYHPEAGGYSWCLLMRVSTVLKLYISSTGSSWNICNGLDIGTISVGVWYHVAISRHGANLYTFLGGTKTQTVAVSTTAFIEGTGNVYIGSSGTDQRFSGWVDEFRFSSGVARFIADFTPPDRPYGIYKQWLLSSHRNRFQRTSISLGI